jgi:transcriptional regulator with XRE-family HTH domain
MKLGNDGEIGSRLREVRESWGESQAQAAEVLAPALREGESATQGRWWLREAGRVSLSLDELRELYGWGVNLEWLLWGGSPEGQGRELRTDQDIARLLLADRKARGWNQQKARIRAGYGCTNWWKHETGKMQVPLSLVRKLEERFQVDSKTLLLRGE